MESRRLRVLDDPNIATIANTYHSWRNYDSGYEDIPGFCKAAALEELTKHDFVLTPGRYVGAPEAEADGEPVNDRIERLQKALFAEFDRGNELENTVRQRLEALRND